MKIKLAKSLGYCLGVRRAMDLAFDQLARRDGPVFSHGPLIHNEAALELLSEKGLRLWDGHGPGTVIIRAHGLPPEEEARLRARPGLAVLDATCPRVAKIQRLVAREAAKGRDVVIWGEAGHPEVAGLLGYAAGRGQVIKNAEEAAALPELGQVLLVAQTTQNLARWPEVSAAVRRRWPEARINNTVCEATESRQEEVRKLAREVEALVVVGGRSSGNTQRLAEVGRELGLKTAVLEKREDIDPAWFAGVDRLGLTAGASAPTWQISGILEALQAVSRAKENSWPGFWRRFLRALVLSNMYAAAGAGGLGLAAGLLAGARPPGYFFSLFFYYILAMHLFRDFAQRETVKFSDPDRLSFHRKYRRPLVALGLASAFLALWGAWKAGPGVAALYTVIGVLAVPYNLGSRPPAADSKIRPFIKPALLGAGWALTLLGPLYLARSPLLDLGRNTLPAVFSGLFIFFSITSVVTMMDVMGAQGDRIFGRSTLPTVFGEKRTRRFLTALLTLWAALIALGLGGVFYPPQAWPLLLSGPLYGLLILRPLFRNPGLQGFYFEAVIYGQFLLTGLWAVFQLRL